MCKAKFASASLHDACVTHNPHTPVTLYEDCIHVHHYENNIIKQKDSWAASISYTYRKLILKITEYRLAVFACPADVFLGALQDYLPIPVAVAIATIWSEAHAAGRVFNVKGIDAARI